MATFGKAKVGILGSNLHIIIDLSSQFEDFYSVLPAVPFGSLLLSVDCPGTV